jgi:hypothetical protein
MRTKPVAPKSLGLVPGTKLSARFDNNRNHYKVVEDSVLAYSVYGDDRVGYRITEILNANIYTRVGETTHISSSWEYGDVLVASPAHIDGLHDSYIAGMVARLIAILRERANRRTRKGSDARR